MKIITFGTFDLFHVGHLNILNRCKHFDNIENELYVGVSSDKLNFSKKQRNPIISENDRIKIVKHIKGVDHVFLEESLEQKTEYCLTYGIDICIMGDDHKGRYDFLMDHNIKVIYLPRTADVSTTDIIDAIDNMVINKD
tara:strand:+ start:331 stop:747 length:417 start_codon:yes stop_codon:yes gene_type:complete